LIGKKPFKIKFLKPMNGGIIIIRRMSLKSKFEEEFLGFETY